MDPKRKDLSGSKLKVLVVAGTRPEVIKVAPVIHALRARGRHEVKVGVSAQHRDLLDQALADFQLEADFDLNLMQPGQDLFGVSARLLEGMREPLQEHAPEIVLVQGDTTTVFMTALAAFYLRIPVGHIEAGLRSGDLDNPFPEEMNRKLTGSLAALHFAPTEAARSNLLREGVDGDSIAVVGNTSIDAAMWIRAHSSDPDLDRLGLGGLDPNAPFVLVTAHRRESFGAPLRSMLSAIGALAQRFPDVRFVYPVHPNPNVKAPATEILTGQSNVLLVDPLPYPAFVWLLSRASLALTDSGGVQEEAPALGTPVLVMREVTERPEAIAAGSALLVGADGARIERVTAELLEDSARLAEMSIARFPYGDGTAATQIAEFLDARASALRPRPE